MKAANDTGYKKLKTNFYSVVVTEVRGVRGVQVIQDRVSVPGATWGGGFPSAQPGGGADSRAEPRSAPRGAHTGGSARTRGTGDPQDPLSLPKEKAHLAFLRGFKATSVVSGRKQSCWRRDRRPRPGDPTVSSGFLCPHQPAGSSVGGWGGARKQ